MSSGHSVSHIDQHLLPMVLQTVHISLQNPNLEHNTNDHLLQTFGDRRSDRMVVEGVVVVVVVVVVAPSSSSSSSSSFLLVLV